MSIKCINGDCAVIIFDAEWCPSCEHDENGHDMSDDAYVARCDDMEAARFEDWAHCGKQDDWDEYYNMRDPITYNDAGEPVGYC